MEERHAGDAANMPPTPTVSRSLLGDRAARRLRVLACASLFGLIVLNLGWELWWAPLRPGGTLLALKTVPLLFAVSGLLRGRIYTMQWVSMLSLLYFMEGVVRAWSDIQVLSSRLALIELVLALLLYVSAILYVRRARKMP